MDFITRGIFLLKYVISGKYQLNLCLQVIAELEEAATRSSSGAGTGMII